MDRDDDADYTHLLVLDLERRPNFPYVQCVTITNSGIRTVHQGRLKLSRSFRVRPLHLPIYGEETHMYHIIAKCHKNSNANDRNRATAALNDFVTKSLKTHMTLEAAVSSLVEMFPSRVLYNKDYSNQNAPLTKYGASSARFKGLLALSSSETDQLATDNNEHDDDFEALRKAFPPRKGTYVHIDLYFFLLAVSTVTPPGTRRLTIHFYRPSVFTSLTAQARKTSRAMAKSRTTTAQATGTCTSPPAATSPTPATPASTNTTISPPARVARQSQTPATTPVAPLSQHAQPPCLPPLQVDNGDDDEGNDTQVLGAPAAKKNKIQEEMASIKKELCDINTRLKRSQDTLHKRIDKIVGSVNHMSQCVDEFNDKFHKILQAVNRSTANDVAKHVNKQASFPFETPEELHDYIEYDPEMVQLIDRYVHEIGAFTASSRHLIPSTSFYKPTPLILPFCSYRSSRA